MEMNQVEWSSAESLGSDGPSLDFIRAVAELLETDAEDLLAEMGYSHHEVSETTIG